MYTQNHYTPDIANMSKRELLNSNVDIFDFKVRTNNVLNKKQIRKEEDPEDDDDDEEKKRLEKERRKFIGKTKNFEMWEGTLFDNEGNVISKFVNGKEEK